MSTVARFYRLAGLVVAILVGLQGCGVSADKAKAEAAIGVFHQHLDAEDFDAGFDGVVARDGDEDVLAVGRPDGLPGMTAGVDCVDRTPARLLRPLR